MVEVAQKLLRALPSPYDKQTAVVCWDTATAEAARQALPGVQLLTAAGGEVEGRLSAKNLLFLGLQDAQVGQTQAYLASERTAGHFGTCLDEQDLWAQAQA